MYSCPTDDIHSIYLDKELPFEYQKLYEEHIQRCPECSRKLERMKKVKGLLSSDCRNCTPDENFTEQSFERLKTKMRYSKNTQRVIQFPAQYAGYGIGAAAAVLLAVIIPVRAGSVRNVSSAGQSVSQITPIERPAATSISNRNIVINGNINDNLAHNVSSGNFENPRFADVDVFRPEFTDVNAVHFQMEMPDFENGRPPRMIRYHRYSGVDMELGFPVTDIQGSYRE